MLSMRFPVASFDAVVCVFGIFFVPDMARAVSELWSRVRPGGKLAVTTGPNFSSRRLTDSGARLKMYGLIWTKASIHGIESIIQQACKDSRDAGVASPKIIPENRFSD